MTKSNVKLSEQEIQEKKMIYRNILRHHSEFFWAIRRRFYQEKSKVPKKFYIDTIKYWLQDEKVEWQVNRFKVIFGNIKNDGWCFVYEWHSGNMYSLESVLLEGEELDKKLAKEKDKEDKKKLQKMKEFGINPEHIGKVYTNISIPEVSIRFDGISLGRRKYPIAFYDFETKSDKVMTLDYFKSKYYCKESENETQQL